MQQLCDLLEREYAEDIYSLKGEFREVNTKDSKSLRRWFLAHPYLTINDLVRIADVCPKTVYCWRRRAGITKATGHPTPRPCTAKPAAPEPPLNWRETDWLERQYEHYSIPQLSRATGLCISHIYSILKNRKVKCRSIRESVLPAHPCFSRAWLVENYVNRGLAQNRCAKLAGVSRYTISTWLSYFKIRIRSWSEQSALNHANNLGQSASTPAQGA